MSTPIMQGGHQEDAEEFFGFYLDTLEEELLAMLAAVSAPPSSAPANTSSTNAAPGKNAKLGSVTGTGTNINAAVGGVVEPPLRNLEGNPRREVPTMGETDKRVDSCLRTMGKCV
jgi:hypothetical protein